jgi:beta-glucanase (GH16 family)
MRLPKFGKPRLDRHSVGHRATRSGLLLLTLLLLGLAGPPAPFCLIARADDPTVWSLVWSDEFDGPSGAAIDASRWTAETGGWGWGNNELEYYTNRVSNAYLENGALVIRADKETYTGPDNVTRNYTSARLITKSKFAQAYGRFEARIKLPYGQGIWPAFWMLGDDIDAVGWPSCGEIDIMENIGSEPATVHGTFHGPGYSGAGGLTGSYQLAAGQKLADDYHTFAVEWEPNVIRFYVDGLLYKTRNAADLPSGTTWVFNHPFFIILNVAVGGNWPGSPDATTVFPQTMKVDYVRVYQRSTPSTIPVVLTEEGTNHALALQSVMLSRDPLPFAEPYFSTDNRTRLILLIANIDLQPGDSAGIVSAQADDGLGHNYPLTVEYVGKVPSFEWITEVVLRLPDGLANVSQARVSVNARGQPSNSAVINLVP